jgi:hypothetical protein
LCARLTICRGKQHLFETLQKHIISGRSDKAHSGMRAGIKLQLTSIVASGGRGGGAVEEPKAAVPPTR